MQRTSTESAMRNRVRHAQSQSRVRVLYQIEDDIWIHSRVLEISDGSHSLCSDDQSAEVGGSTSSTEHHQLVVVGQRSLHRHQQKSWDTHQAYVVGPSVSLVQRPHRCKHRTLAAIGIVKCFWVGS